MKFFEEFKRFAFKGNVVDLAVGVVIGGAFSKIVSALVDDVVMPTVALFMPSGDWRTHGLVIRAAHDKKDDVVVQYGHLIGAILDFFIIALVLFVVVKKIVLAAEAHLAEAAAPVPPTTKVCPACLEVIPLKARRCRACTSEVV